MLTSTSRQKRRHGSKSIAARRKVDSLLLDAREAQATGRALHALDLCEAAIGLDPQNIDALCMYGSLATKAGRPEVAIEAGSRAIKLRSDCVEAHYCVGVAMRHLGQAGAATTSLGRAVELQPDHLHSLIELCMVFLDAGDTRAAEPFLNRALDIEANSSLAQTALGRYYRSAGRLDDAIVACRRAIGIDASQPEAYIHLGNLLRDAGNLDGSMEAFEQAIAIAPNRADTWSNLLLTMQCSDRLSARQVAEKHREFGRHFGKLLRPLPSPPRAAPLAGRLKIGYLSANFRRHAVSKFFEPLIASHDSSRFEIHCYYSHSVTDEVTARIRERAAHFHSVCGMRDGYVAAQIRRDGIDILVDLDGHTAPNRLPVFFLRPAPIQVTWVGYLSTTGVAAIDYRLTDARADPPGIADDLHTETLWRLPSTAWCYSPYDEAPSPGPLPASENGYVTFVSLNNPGKVTLSILELWARIMCEVEGSRLAVHVTAQPSRISEVEAFFTARGIATDRLMLVERQSIDRYLALYGRADIALDTWPCAGGTTTCDALWMGVPVVTLTGDASFSRTGASLLTNAGLRDLVADTPDAYVGIAVALARDPARLAALRADLAPRMRASCLTNGPEFAREVESAYLGMQAHRAARREARKP